MKLRQGLIVACVACVACLGCRKDAPLPKETWSSTPPNTWPQLVLTNEAEFVGHTPLHGASAFLVVTDKGKVLAATAKHLIGANGGVSPTVPIREFDVALRSWAMYPRTAPDKVVVAEKLGCTGLDDGDADWLILSLRDASSLPALPLRLRPRPVRVGDTVFLVGCPYEEEDCRQNVYRGKVTERWRTGFRYDIDPPVDLRGFSGAPILDEDGHVAGVMSLGFEARKQGDKYLEGGAEDAASVRRLVER